MPLAVTLVSDGLPTLTAVGRDNPPYPLLWSSGSAAGLSARRCVRLRLEPHLAVILPAASVLLLADDMTPPTLILASLMLLATAVAGGALNATANTPFSSCAEPHDPIALRIKGCTKQPCNVVKGTVAEMEVDFEVGWDVSQLDVVVTAYALNTVINFPLKQKNACMSLTNAECPLDQFEEITYKLQLDIDAKYPSLSLAAEVALQDKSKKTMTCFKVSLQVVDPA
ncbi:NPC intracellular cholesterol transporter 2 [Frankliniella fusca]|uniref:NPC intracellular cholesterol transporter 2 n=1 Tax=Frankliniella fusca TaxID=407009 RepID=A0AAE1LQQ0_9NEOP|nr:NPC intracellular cholesterol transporter 2 [Frankliniella fusca]